MLAAVFRGPGELEVGEIETPEIGPDEVLVKIGANTVCGTDVRILRGQKTKGIGRNVVLGHELAGHVAAVGRNVKGYEVGAPVGLAPTIACRRCYFCRRGLENVCANKKIVGNIVDYSGSKLEQPAVGETKAKYIDTDGLKERLERLREVWPALREKVKEQLMPAGELRERLRAAGCTASPTEIGLSWEEFKATYRRALMLRKRYTVLDLATETGMLDECVEELFAPGGFWARDSAPQAQSGRVV